jgi:hypothetical protein
MRKIAEVLSGEALGDRDGAMGFPGVPIPPPVRRSSTVYADTRSGHAISRISIHRGYNPLSSRGGAERSQEGVEGAIRAGLCRILYVNFREFRFHALGCIREK